MFLFDYRKTSLTYDDVQFAMSIALDNLNELIAAKSVLNFMGPNDKSGIGQNRGRLWKTLAQDGKNPVSSLIEYFMSNKVFVSRRLHGRTSIGADRVTLQELLVKTNQSEIYQRTMSLLLKHPVRDLIAVYTSTGMFKIEFANFVRRDCGSTNRKGGSSRVSDSTIDTLLSGFTKFVFEYCATGEYATSSCNPNAFLFKRRGENGTNDGPVAWYQMSGNGEYYRILNSRGMYSDLGGHDDFTYIDVASVDTHINNRAIDFIGICTKISNASRLLFSHGSSNDAYYDIFSYHRNTGVRELQKEFSKLGLVGCTIDCNDKRPIACHDNQTISNKFNCRSKICDIFERILTNGVRKAEVRDLYYEVISTMKQECSGPSGTKDAKSPFSIGNYKSREPGTNGSRFITILYGYLALKELLDFIECNSSLYGIDVNDFPTEIFRISGMLNRVHSFDEYLKYGNEIKELYSEVIASPKRSRDVEQGMYSNDYVYRFLSHEQLLKNDVTLQLLSASPISFICSVVDKFRDADKKDDILMENARKTGWEWSSVMSKFSPLLKLYSFSKQTDIFSADRLVNVPGAVLNKISFILANEVNKLTSCSLERARYSLWSYAVIAAFSSVLRAASLKEGDKPIYNSVGRYLIKDKTLLGAVFLPDEYVNVLGEEVITQYLLQRARAIRVCMWVLWGTQDEVSEIDRLEASWDDYWHFWCITTKLSRFIVVNDQVVASVCRSEDIHLMLIMATHYVNFIGMLLPKTGRFSFDVLSTPLDPKLFVSRNEVERYSEVLALSKKRMNKAFRLLSGALYEMLKVYDSIIKRVDIAFSSLASYSKDDGDDGEILVKYVDTMESYVLLGEADPAIAQKLSVMAEFDEYGYVRNRFRRYCFESRTYVHRTGFMITVDRINRQGVIKPVSDEVLLALEMTVNFGR